MEIDDWTCILALMKEERNEKLASEKNLEAVKASIVPCRVQSSVGATSDDDVDNDKSMTILIFMIRNEDVVACSCQFRTKLWS